MRQLLAFAFAATVAVVATRARADDAILRPASISVRASACRDAPWSGDAWVELLRVELAADGIAVHSAPSATSAGAPQVALDAATCAASAESVTLTFAFGDTTRTRIVALTDVAPAARARVVAIAMAELVRSSLATMRSAGEALGAPASTPAIRAPLRLEVDVRFYREPLPPTRSEPDVRAPFVVTIGGEARSFSLGGAGLFGARGGVRWSIARWAAVIVDAGVLFGGARDPLGEVDEELASLGASLLGTGGSERVWFGVGPRIEAGVARFRGHAFDPSTLASSVNAPVAFFALAGVSTFRIAGSLSGLVALDAGTSLRSYGASADDRRVASFAGAMLSIRIGVAWAPWR